MRMTLPVVFFLLAFPMAGAAAEDESWVVGRWQQAYDPEDTEIDYLEFRENGDVVSISSIGEYSGFYIVTPGVVKAVLEVGKKDLILTFFHNEAKNRLRIVTSDTGIETVYEKVAPK